MEVRGYVIVCHNHAFDHLVRAERSVYEEQVLVRVVAQEVPRLIGWQRNERVALYFRRRKRWLKIIVVVDRVAERIVILTFMNVDTIPNIRRMPVVRV